MKISRIKFCWKKACWRYKPIKIAEQTKLIIWAYWFHSELQVYTSQTAPENAVCTDRSANSALFWPFFWQEIKRLIISALHWNCFILFPIWYFTSVLSSLWLIGTSCFHFDVFLCIMKIYWRQGKLRTFSRGNESWIYHENRTLKREGWQWLWSA